MSKPNRRKGNAKTASSAAAASYLGDGAVQLGLNPEANIFDVGDLSQEPGIGVSPEARIVLRKLVKKDLHTREKGLRELLEMLQEMDVVEVEACYDYTIGIFDRLITDGSSTVRVFSLKTLSYFISKLKKSASKGLKKAMPLVLLALSDVSASVVVQADNVLKENFDEEKRSQALNVFAPPAVDICIEILTGQSDLTLPATSEEETPQQRVFRLTAQALSTIQKVAQLLPETPSAWADKATTIFDDVATVQRILGSPQANVKASLLSLCLLLPEKVTLIVDSPLCNWIINSLDSQESAVCAVAWNAFVTLASEKRFFEKVSLAKTTIPRVLNVVRKKESHWLRMAHFLLPATALLSGELKAQPDGQVAANKLVSSLLESFLFNLPFANTSVQTVVEWANSFSELLQWALSQPTVNESAERDVQKLAVKLTVEACDLVVSWKQQEVEKRLAALVRWLLEKKVLNASESQETVLLIELNIINKSEESANLCKELLGDGDLDELAGLHAATLRHATPAPFYAIRALFAAADTYVLNVHKRVNLLKAITPTRAWDAPEATQIVGLLERLVGDLFDVSLGGERLVMTNDAFCRCLVARAAGNQKLWSMSGGVAGKETFAEMLKAWVDEKDGCSAARVLNALEDGVRAELCDGLLELHEVSSCTDIKFVSELLVDCEKLPEKTREALSNVMFSYLFRAEQLGNDSIYSLIGRFPPMEEVLDGFLKRFVTIIDVSHLASLATTVERLLDALPEAKKGYFAGKLLVNEANIDQIIKKFAFLDCDILAEEQLTVGEADLPCSSTRPDDVELINSDSLLHDVTAEMAFALTCLSVSEEHMDEVAHGFAALLLTLLQFTSLRCLYARAVEETQPIVNEIREKLDVNKAYRVLATHLERINDANKSILLLETLSKFLPPLCEADSEGHSETDQRLGRLSATTLASLGVRVPESDDALLPTDTKWSLRYSSEPAEAFLKQLKSILDDGSANDEESDLFTCSLPLEHRTWVLNVLVQRALERLNESSSLFDHADKSFVDFVLCGLVTLFDGLDEATRGESMDLRVELLASLALRTFTQISRAASARSEENANVKEWNEFFSNTIQPIVFRWIGYVKKGSVPSPFVRSLLATIQEFSELPENAELEIHDRQVLPELDAFLYSDADQTMIIHAFDLIDSAVPDVQLLGLHLAKLLMPKMFKHENRELQTTEGEETVVLKKEMVKMPTILPTMLNQWGGTGSWGSVLLLDVGLVPFQASMGLTDELRMAYCDAVTPLVTGVLPTLFSKFPERIAKGNEREYMTAPDWTPSSVFFDRFIAHLLYRVLGAVPAVCRIWYRGLPVGASNIVARIVKSNASRLLVEAELDKVLAAKKELTGGQQELKIRVVPTTGEVRAEYTLDDTTMKLSFALPADWPLSVPNIDLQKSIVRSERSNRWLLQLSAYLFHQNGSVVEGIMIWRRNVERNVEGAEPCTICMNMVHTTTHQLPKVRCKQCKNRFHRDCLFKWFESSNQASCPLCRNNFM